ncbi:MAG: hypothetical protein QJR08_07685 [Bacillota bacterium]|nr:hypothetical protein [Bacillota bacterium]
MPSPEAGARERWSPERIAERIRARQAAGLGLGAGAVLRDEPKLYYAACKHLGSWHEALEAAGVDAAAAPRRPRVTREAVVAELRRWAAEDPVKTAASLQKASPRLYMRAYRLLGSWAAICEAAGLPVEAGRGGEDPYAALPPRELYELWRNAKPRPLALRAAIARRFGSVQGLRDRLGIAVKWTPDKVVEGLREFAASGRRVTVEELRRAGCSGLAAAAMRLFPSFEAAREAAGIVPQAPAGGDRTPEANPSGPARALRVKWTPEKALAALRDFAGSGRAVTASELRRAGRWGLVRAVYRLFGNFEAARQAAGLPGPPEFAALGPEELYALWRTAKPRPRGLRAAIRERFGSVQSLRRELGLDSHWSAEKVAEALREFARSGRSVTAAELRKARRWGLLAAAYRLFGRLDAARRAAGLPSAEDRAPAQAQEGWRPIARAEREKMQKLYDEWTRRGRSPRLRRKIERRFGSVRRLAGFLGHDRVWTEKAVVRALRELHRKGLRADARTLRRVDTGLFYAVYHLFGSLPRARQAAGIPEPEDRRLAGLPRDLSALGPGELYRLLALHPRSRRLRREIRRRFGSLRALGSAPGRAGRWSRERVLAALRERMSGGAVDEEALWKERPDLAAAAVRRFGSVEAALERAAGAGGEKSAPGPATGR